MNAQRTPFQRDCELNLFSQNLYVSINILETGKLEKRSFI